MPRRRQVLGAIGGGAAAGNAGCVQTARSLLTQENDEWTPEVTVEEPDLQPGEETILHLEAEPVKKIELRTRDGIGWASDFGDRSVVLDDNNWSISPNPVIIQISGRYTFRDQTVVTIDLPAWATQDADPGEYVYEVRVWGTAQEPGLFDPPEYTRESIEFTIQVVE